MAMLGTALSKASPPAQSPQPPAAGPAGQAAA